MHVEAAQAELSEARMFAGGLGKVDDTIATEPTEVADPPAWRRRSVVPACTAAADVTNP